jgi:hypothetical protein
MGQTREHDNIELAVLRSTFAIRKFNRSQAKLDLANNNIAKHRSLQITNRWKHFSNTREGPVQPHRHAQPSR